MDAILSNIELLAQEYSVSVEFSNVICHRYSDCAERVIITIKTKSLTNEFTLNMCGRNIYIRSYNMSSTESWMNGACVIVIIKNAIENMLSCQQFFDGVDATYKLRLVGENKYKITDTISISFVHKYCRLRFSIVFHNRDSDTSYNYDVNYKKIRRCIKYHCKVRKNFNHIKSAKF